MHSADRHLAAAQDHLNEAVRAAQIERDAVRFNQTATIRQRERLAERVGALIVLASMAAELLPLEGDPVDAA
jgi:hypothetical protein